jgi:hypothetical protein
VKAEHGPVAGEDVLRVVHGLDDQRPAAVGLVADVQRAVDLRVVVAADARDVVVVVLDDERDAGVDVEDSMPFC